ncbi:MAG: glycosyl hydrolase, partial [Planctomycetaceae bacterium]|nr:glycosyl hydrolase [Planctomycetaceae bacterium]
ICEDTDGDHVADRFTVFAEGLSIPTAIVIVRGGAVVQNGTETIYLKDLNGDDIADQKTTLISNWELGDTHGGVSNFRYGLDNWIWAMQGYNNSSPRIDGKPTQTFRMGFWRFKLSQTDPPQVTDLEFVRSSNNNTWGLGISEDGLIFGSTANHNPSMFVPIPNRYYERVRGWAPSVLGTIADTHLFKPITENIRQVDHHGGYTAAAGHALYTARTFPEQWWNKTAFVCGPTGHLIGTFVLNRDGANYTSTSPVNLLASNDEWSAPIMAEVGPDGSVWVIDWYNYIVQHNPTPQGFETGKGHAYESDLRDKKHGRIYRVVASEGGQDVLHPFTSLTEANNAELVKALTHPSFPWRLQAQRLLIERNAQDAIKPLLALLSDQSVDAIGLNVGAIHALQTLHELGYFNLQDAQAFVKSGVEVIALNDALKHPSAGVRRNAISILPQNEAGLEILLSNEQVFADSDFQVRLQALLSLADMPASSTAGELIARLTTTTKDPVLKDGLTSAAAVHAVPFLKSLATQKGSQPDEGLLQLVSRVAEHIGRQKPDATTLQDVLLAIQQGPRETASAILTGLTAGLPSQFEFKTTSDFDAALVEAFNNAAAESKSKLIRLASQCHTNALESRSQEIINALSKLISDSKA